MRYRIETVAYAYPENGADFDAFITEFTKSAPGAGLVIVAIEKEAGRIRVSRSESKETD